ncbi:ABC transporter permease subunit [Corynebacterium freneyi]
MIARRVATVVVSSVALLVLTALLPWLTGREPAYSVLRAREREREATPELIEAIRTEYDLPTSPWESLSQWFGGAVRGDFGTSWVTGRDALAAATHGLGITIALTIAATVTSVLLAFIIVLPRIIGSRAGRWTPGILAILAALPSFVLAVLLLSWFAVGWRIFPVGGWNSVAHMVLPTLAIGLPAAGLYGRVLLISVDTALAEPWVESWRLNGVTKSTIVRYVAMRAFLPALSQLTLFFVGTLAATAAIEVAFNIPGFGRDVVDAATAGDIPVLQAAVAVVLLFGIIFGTVAQVARATVSRKLAGGAAPVARPTVFGGGVGLALSMIPIAFIAAGLPRSAAIESSRRLQAPSWSHPLGTDQLGRDIWARLADGIGSTIGIAVIVTVICALIALVLGHMGPSVQYLGDAMNAVPAILLGLVLAGVLGRSVLTASIAVLLVGWIPLAAHCAEVAAEAAATGHYRYARTMGAGRWHLLRHHVLPTTVPAVTKHAVTRIAHNAIALASLGFLGVGAAVGSPDWGVILNESTNYLERSPWMAWGPMIGLASLGVAATIATDRFVGRRAAK